MALQVRDVLKDYDPDYQAMSLDEVDFKNELLFQHRMKNECILFSTVGLSGCHRLHSFSQVRCRILYLDCYTHFCLF